MAEESVMKTEKVEIRVTAEEKESLRMAAARMGLTISDFVRMTVMDVARASGSGASSKEVVETFAGTATFIRAKLVEPEPVEFVVEGDTVKLGDYSPGKVENVET